jgi:hypothetical protein
VIASVAPCGEPAPFVVPPPLHAAGACKEKPRAGGGAKYQVKASSIYIVGQASLLRVITHPARPGDAGAHVAERRGLDRFVDASGRHAANVARPVAAWEGYGVPEHSAEEIPGRFGFRSASDPRVGPLRRSHARRKTADGFGLWRLPMPRSADSGERVGCP